MLPKCNIIYFDPRFTRQISRGQETMPGKTEDTRLRAYPIITDGYFIVIQYDYLWKREGGGGIWLTDVTQVLERSDWWEGQIVDQWIIK